MQGSNKRAERLVVQALPQKFRPRVERRELRWSPSAMKTAEVLLQKITQVGGDSSLVVPTTAELSRLTGTSSVQASRTLQEFDGAGYTVKRGRRGAPVLGVKL